jgi:Zn-dependent protease with chaperone function
MLHGVSSNEPETLTESPKQIEFEPARPLEPGVGFGSRSHRRRTVLEVTLLMAILVGLFFLFRVVAKASVDPVVKAIPAGTEAALGEWSAKALSASMGELQDAHRDRVLQLVSQVKPAFEAELAKRGRASTELSVYVADTADVNAFALPGGHVFVLRGLLDSKDVDDAVVLGVIAHELGHVVGRHVLKGLVRRHAFRVGLALALGGLDGQALVLLAQGMKFDSLAYDRSMEAEADALGASMLQAIGAPVEPLAKFLEDIDKFPAGMALFMNHPGGKERAAALREMSQASRERPVP